MNLDDIKAARSAIDLYPNVEILEDVFVLHNDYYVKVAITIEKSISLSVPLTTNWYIRFNENSMDFFPAKDGGITCTFQHQNLNIDIGDKYPFLSGKLCLDKTYHIFDDRSFDYLPEKYGQKFVWYLNRALRWIESAANNKLVKDGDPFELPEINCNYASEFIFKEGPLELWKGFNHKFGYAKIDKFSNDKYDYFLLRELYNLDYDEARGTLFWGDYFDDAEKFSKYSLWIRLERPPIIDPWMFPRTWEELFAFGEKQGIDIKGIISRLLVSSDMLSAGMFLAIVYPIPRLVGGDDVTMSWIFMDLPEFNFPTKGFRNILSTKLRYYMSKFKGEIKYYHAENLYTDCLLSRGRINDRIARKNTAIIGLGALGSVLAENFSRIGFENLHLFDGDRFIFSNVARHILGIDSHNKDKCEEVRSKIIKNNPNLKVACHSDLTYKNVASLSLCDMVIDCSANMQVLKILSSREFEKEKLFVIAAMSYGACDFIVYFFRSKKFDYKEYCEKVLPTFKSLVSDLNLEEKDLVMQGIGCYHPVFPARFDDVNIWGSTLVKVIDSVYFRSFTSCCVHWRKNDLSVEVVDEWEK